MHRSRARSAIAVLALASSALAAAAPACGPGSIGDLTAGRADAGPDASDERDASAEATTCVSAREPERPTTPDSTNGPVVVFALDDLRFETGEFDAGLGKPAGLDIDRTCTCPGPESCVPPPSNEPRACDGDGGRDNAIGPLLATLATLVEAFRPDAIRGQIQAGAFTSLVTVQGWNGTPNDPQVIVSVRHSAGIEGIQNDGGRTRPRFDGTDAWTVDPSSILDGDALIGESCEDKECVPLHLDARAYVRDDVLVAHFDVPIRAETKAGRLSLEFVAATLTAQILRDGGNLRLRGEVAGRWIAERVLATLPAVRGLFGKSLCGDDAVYKEMKKVVCASVDVAGDPAQDNKGAPCTALSDAVSFSGSPARLGTVYRPPIDPTDCPGFVDTCPR